MSIGIVAESVVPCSISTVNPAALPLHILRGGSRISEKGGLLINIHEAGEGVWGGAPAANAFLFYHAHNTT